jgi:hypothetical protein
LETALEEAQDSEDFDGGLESLLQEALEEVEQRQANRDECLKTAKQSQTLSQEVKDYDYSSGLDQSEQTEEQALEATDLAEEAFEQQNPSDDKHREAVNEAIEEAIDALKTLPEETDAVKDALDRLERLMQKQKTNETKANEKWGVWNLDERSWVEVAGGSPLQFDDEEEAKDWLNARGGMI